MTDADLLAEVIAERWGPPELYLTLLAEATVLERTAHEGKWRKTVDYWDQPLRGRKA